MDLVSLLASIAAVVVAALAAWWSRQAAQGTAAATATVEHGLSFRWACEQAGSGDPQVRAAGIKALTVMMDLDELSPAELRLFKAVGTIYVKDVAAYPRQSPAGESEPASGGTP